MNKKNAFSFTELMIVVALIGVIASFMIPALVKVEPDETALTYKKVFYALEEAISTVINNLEIYPWGDLSLTNVAIPTGATGDAITGYEEDPKGEYLCRQLAETMNTIGAIKCTESDGRATLKIANDGELEGDENLTADKVNFTLSNGAAIGGIGGDVTANKNIWDATNDDRTTAEVPFITLCVDINGMAAGINKGCATADRAERGRDQFRIRVNKEGKVYTDYPVGPNNWYLENKMLINPRAVTKDKNPLTASEITELTKNQDAALTETTKDKCPTDLDYILVGSGDSALCVYTAGYDEMTIRRKKKETPRDKANEE